MNDSFLTISSPTEALFKDKGSKFIAYAYPVETEEEIKEHIQALKKEHYAARHHCYAWRLGADLTNFRANDDGEPSSTAGKPILGQIQKSGLTNILIVVVRYFGGVLLGTSGLINAYRNAAALSIEAAEIEEQLVMVNFWVEFDYLAMNDVMKVFKNELIEQKKNNFDLRCRILTAVRENDSERIIKQFEDIEGVKVKK
ncbi:MAG: IMPACT family protein [Mangrovibacterium sp.]